MLFEVLEAHPELPVVFLLQLQRLSLFIGKSFHLRRTEQIKLNESSFSVQVIIHSLLLDKKLIIFRRFILIVIFSLNSRCKNPFKSLFCVKKKCVKTIKIFKIISNTKNLELTILFTSC